MNLLTKIVFSGLFLINASIPINTETFKRAEVIQQATPIEIIQFMADKYHVNEKTMIKLINCEDPTWNPEQQSNYYRNGIREESYGPAQINIPSWKEITKQQAEDWTFSMDFMAYQLSKGNIGIWSCSKKTGLL